MFHLNFTEKNSKFRRTMVPVDVSFKFGGWDSRPKYLLAVRRENISLYVQRFKQSHEILSADNLLIVYHRTSLFTPFTTSELLIFFDLLCYDALTETHSVPHKTTGVIKPLHIKNTLLAIRHLVHGYSQNFLLGGSLIGRELLTDVFRDTKFIININVICKFIQEFKLPRLFQFPHVLCRLYVFSMPLLQRLTSSLRTLSLSAMDWTGHT
jgi:hypothetical protein